MSDWVFSCIESLTINTIRGVSVSEELLGLPRISMALIDGLILLLVEDHHPHQVLLALDDGHELMSLDFVEVLVSVIEIEHLGVISNHIVWPHSIL